MDQGQEDVAIRRRRKVTRSMREKTPDPIKRQARKYSDGDENNSVGIYENVSTTDPEIVQTISMQIRPPGSMSAHHSKILRRRDKTFADAAARSHSQPRQAERLSSPEAYQLLNTAKRSLSSPRHKEDLNEPTRNLSPPSAKSLARSGEIPLKNLSRQEQNLRRFEEERKRFDLDKRLFEKEKRDHKIRYRQFLDNEERKRLLESYRQTSGKLQVTTTDSGNERHVTEITKNERVTNLNHRRRPVYESSTPLSSSESEAIHVESKKETLRAVNSRGPPPAVPQRKNPSRNNSLSPIKPERRRSKTPEMKTEENNRESTLQVESAITPQIQIDEDHSIRRRSDYRKSSTNLEKQCMDPPKEAILSKSSIFTKLFSFFRRGKKDLTKDNKDIEDKNTSTTAPERIFTKVFLRQMLLEMRIEWRQLKADYPNQVKEICCWRNKCFGHMIMLTLLCGFGGLMFRYTEGTAEDIYKCEVRKVKRDFIDYLWTVSHNMR